jgi:hypothetical protein
VIRYRQRRRANLLDRHQVGHVGNISAESCCGTPLNGRNALRPRIGAATVSSLRKRAPASRR